MRSRKRSPWRSITLATRVMSIRSEPMPIITVIPLAHDPPAATIHGGAHAADGLAETHEQRLPHHEVADVEFGDLGQCRDRLGCLVVEAVSGMDLEPGGPRQLRARDDALPFRVGL